MTEKNLREIRSASRATSPVSNRKSWRAGELRRRRNQDDVVGADQSDDGWAERLVAAAEHEALRSDRAEHELALAIAVEKFEDLAFG